MRPNMRSLVYFASALFSSREQLFNREICRRLESGEFGDFRVLLPQRDGFEFSSLGQRLARSSSQKLSPRQLSLAVETIIYTLDMGVFLTAADGVVAVLDEPLDEGLLVEISYARQLGIPVVGVRTDARTPFGSPGDPLGGIHFFAAFQCNDFIAAPPSGSAETLDDLVRSIAESLRSARCSERGRIDPLLEAAAKQLFQGFKALDQDLHDNAALDRIVDNYLARLDLFDGLAPRVLVPGK
jgi:nucleoside 2-deoxyribosyltransferase